MKKFWKIMMWLTISLVIFVVVVVSLMMADIWDIDPPDVSDLIPERIEVADEDNAYTYFKLMSESLYFPDDEFYEEKGVDLLDQIRKILKGELKDDNLVNDLLNKNKKSLRLLDKALACKLYQAPSWNESNDDNGLGDFKIRELCYLINLSFLQAVYDADFVKAQEIMKTSTHLSQLMANSRDSMALIHSMFRLHAQNDIIINDKIPMKYMRLILDNLPDCRFYDSLLINDSKAVFEGYSIFIDELASGEGNLNKLDAFFGEPGYIEKMVRNTSVQINFLLHKNRTKEILADIYRDDISKIHLPYSKQNLKRRYKLIPGCDENYHVVGLSNVIGKYLCLDLQSVYMTSDWKFKCQTELEGLRLTVACKLYKRKHGLYPSSLDDLVPVYLDNVPNDPFDGKPMRYDPKRKLIYSVGSDLVDSGGLTRKEVWRLRDNNEAVEDLVYYLEEPSAKK